MTEEARVYRCPACGGPTPEAARRCDYCRAPVATLRCAGCFHMNPPEARHCSGCGQELGSFSLESITDTECPECRVPLLAIACNAGALLDCERCGGQFVEHSLLRAFLLQREALARAVSGPTRRKNPLQETVVYRPCPTCRKLMHRKNFGGSSGIIVDLCTLHGSWFEAGELPSVLAFVEAGGLERAREAEVLRTRPDRVGLAHSTDVTWKAETAPGLGEAALALLEFVMKLLDKLARSVR